MYFSYTIKYKNKQSAPFGHGGLQPICAQLEPVPRREYIAILEAACKRVHTELRYKIYLYGMFCVAPLCYDFLMVVLGGVGVGVNIRSIQ